MNDLPEEINAKLDDQTDRDLAKRISFGFGVKEWLKSEFAHYICERDEQEREGLILELIACDTGTPEGIAENRKLRFRIGIIDHWQERLAEAVQEGEAAEKEFRARNEQ